MKKVGQVKVGFVTVVSLVLLLLLVMLGFSNVNAATGDPVLLNEVLASHTGADNTEFVELYGIPGTSLDGLSLIVVESSSISSQGDIDERVDFGPADILGSNGFYLIGNETGLVASYSVIPNINVDLNLENDNLTVALVQTASISGTAVTSSEIVLDAVALQDPASGLFYFSAPVIGPDGTFFPAGARRVSDGIDTDMASDWVISDFFLGPANTPTGGDTPPPPPPPFFTIMEIQGDGQFSSHEGEIVTTSGVVTLITANGRDMWIQDLAGDGSPETSDGIFVDDRNNLSPEPQIGDLITITGEVEEQQFDAQLPRTRIDDTELVEITSSDNPLPTPVELIDLPNDSLIEGIAFWEPLEGMLVSVENGRVVAPTTRFGEFGMVAESDAEPGSGYYPQTKQILLESLGPNVVDYNPERILVDDASLDDPIVVMPGDIVRSLTGVVDYTFGMYKLQPASFDVKNHKLPKLPASNRSGPNGNLVITSFNVENLFDLKWDTSVDVIGQVGFDPGSQWGSDLKSTKDNTIRRLPSICQGDPFHADQFEPSLEWDGFPKNTFDGLGSHTVECTNVSGLFISEYVEGSSFNKAVEIYNGTGVPVNLAAGGYKVQIYFNGSSSVGRTISLSGNLADGATFVLSHSSADAAIMAVADQTSSSVLFNGDDAVVLSAGGKDDASSTPSASELETQLTKLALAIEKELELPEIIVVQEIENQAIAQELADRVNSAAGTAYVATSFETSDGRGIEPGFLWDANRVDLLSAFQMSGPDVEAAFGPGSASPGREPIVGVFDVKGNEITIIGNHFKSKGGDDPPFGVSFNRITEVQRKLQAQVVRDFVNTILEGDPDTLVMVTGDLNDFQFGEPGEGPDHPVAILEGVGGGVPLTNLLEFEKDAELYTFVFDGNSQILDHMLVSPALLDLVEAADILHFNAGYPSDLGEDTSTTLRASDHDPLEARFKFK